MIVGAQARGDLKHSGSLLDDSGGVSSPGTGPSELIYEASSSGVRVTTRIQMALISFCRAFNRDRSMRLLSSVDLVMVLEVDEFHQGVVLQSRGLERKTFRYGPCKILLSRVSAVCSDEDLSRSPRSSCQRVIERPVFFINFIHLGFEILANCQPIRIHHFSFPEWIFSEPLNQRTR